MIKFILIKNIIYFWFKFILSFKGSVWYITIVSACTILEKKQHGWHMQYIITIAHEFGPFIQTITVLNWWLECDSSNCYLQEVLQVFLNPKTPMGCFFQTQPLKGPIWSPNITSSLHVQFQTHRYSDPHCNLPASSTCWLH